MKIKIIKEAFKQSQAVQECRDRLLVLTKGKGDVEEKFNELWDNFKGLLKETKEESKELEEKVEKAKAKDIIKNLPESEKPETYQQFVSRMGREENIKDFKVISKLWAEEKEKRNKK